MTLMTLKVGIQWGIIDMDSTIILLTVGIPVLVVGLVFAMVYTSQWLTSLLFSLNTAMDDMYMGEE